MNRFSGSVVAVSLLIATGCIAATTPESSYPQWTGSIEVRGGVTYVENPERGLWDAVSEPIRFELEQLFGVDSAPEEAILGNIAGLVIDNDRNVHVYDSQANQLVSFAPDGSLTQRSGGPGEGPGGNSTPRAASPSTGTTRSTSSTKRERDSISGERMAGIDRRDRSRSPASCAPGWAATCRAIDSP